MNKSFNILRFFFHTLNIITIVLYLYPGSILGWLIYGNFQFQPQLTKDFLNISSNHIYVFFLLSILGLLCYFNHPKFKFLIYYLFFFINSTGTFSYGNSQKIISISRSSW